MKTRSSASAPAILAALTLLAALLTTIFVWLTRYQPLDQNIPEVIALLLAAGALYLTSVWVVIRFEVRGRSALMIILGAAVLFRIIIFPLPPSLSNDLYRYAWEGRMQLEGYNPYAHAPSSDDVAHLRPPEYPILPGRDVPAAYGPAVELVFRGAALLGGLAAFKFVSLLFDLASLLFLLLLLRSRGHPPTRAIVYAWCPLVVLEFAGQGHNDSMMVAFLLMGLWLLQGGRPLTASAGIALAIVSKWTAGLLLPLLIRRGGWKAAAVAAGVSFAVMVPYIDPQANLLAGVGMYAQQWRNNASLFDLVRWVTGVDGVALGLAVSVTGGIALFLAWKKTEPIRAAFLLMTTVLLLAPSVFPWYLTWMVPFLAFYPNPALLLWTVTVVLSYHVVIGYSALGLWEYDPWLTALQYAPVFVLALALLATQKRKTGLNRATVDPLDMAPG